MGEAEKRRKVWLALLTAVSVFFAWFALSRLASVALAVSAAGLSALAAAATASGDRVPDAVSGPHLPAALGALAGSLVFLTKIGRGRPRPEVGILFLANLTPAYFAGVAVADNWHWGLGGAGAVASGVGAVFMAATDAALALLRDVPWWKKLIERRLGVQEDKPDCE